MVWRDVWARRGVNRKRKKVETCKESSEWVLPDPSPVSNEIVKEKKRK
jgi:hypothetical protein